MKRFQFGLDTVLQYKRQVLDGAQNEYAEAIQRVRQQERRLREAEARHRSLNQQFRRAEAEGITIADAMGYEMGLRMLEGEIQREDGVWEVCWFYNTSGSADVQYDLRLRFTNTGMRDGSGSVLSEVWTQSPCNWTLDTGIGIGSPQEAVEAAYPDAVWTHETMIENDQEIPYDLYELTSGDLFMLIRVEAGEVSHISFGGLNAEHFLDEDEPAPTDPYTFTPYDTLSGGTVTAYSRTESGWEKQVLTEKRAKHLVTALNIMDPEPSAVQGEPVIWLEFESGGVAALYDESGAGAIYRLEDTSAFEAALSSGEDPTDALTLIEYCIFPGVWDDVLSALEA